MTRTHRLVSIIVVALWGWSGAAAGDAVTDWNEIAANAVAVGGRPGPMHSIDMAVVAVAMHDAVQASERRFEPYFAEVPRAPRSLTAKSAAVAAAAHAVLVGMYPSQAATLDATYATYLANNGLTGSPGEAVGNTVGAMILPLRRADPNPPLPPFTGNTGIGQWRPTPNFQGNPPPPPSPMAALQMATFDPYTLTGFARFRAPPPPELTSARYTEDYNEVKSKGAFTNSTRSPEQTDIARFWTDNFHVQWNRALRAIALGHIPELGDRARLFALANLAAADSLITSWDSKLFYNYWRPVTAIQEGDNDGNPHTAGDPTWQPLVNTPPYPDYTSGANNITAAMARTICNYFGTNHVTFEVTSSAPLAIKKSRTFHSCSQVMAQVVNARIYLGIHFRTADVAARRQGIKVADHVFDHFLLPISH